MKEKEYSTKREPIERRYKVNSAFMNEVSADTAKTHTDFMYKISIVSIGTIPLSLTLLAVLIENQLPLNEYKQLLYFGWLGLFIAGATGALYAMFIADSTLFLGYLSRYSIEKEFDNLDIEFMQSNIGLLSDEQKSDLETRKETLYKKEALIGATLKSASRTRSMASFAEITAVIGFILGIGLVIAYFSAQIFDFALINNITLLSL